MPEAITDPTPGSRMETISELVEALKRYNEAYREGHPLVSDAKYDELVETLRSRDPDNPYLVQVEPERLEGKLQVRHPVPMLSTEKAYTREQLKRFLDRVVTEGAKIGVSPVRFKITPKLDGLAGRDDGQTFVSRGNGEVGYEISSAFEKGVVPIGGRGKGIGEIVIQDSYFQEHLSEIFEHPRNMVVGIVSSDAQTLNEHAKMALQDRAVHFVPYTELPQWTGSSEALFESIDEITADLTRKTDYPMDGLVVETVDETLKAQMGATTHHYRWQIAIKTRGETAISTVIDVKWQVGRLGNVTPVIEVSPVSLSGATIRRVTAHHAGLVIRKRIGKGAKIEIIRSGEVIPKLEETVRAADHVPVPDRCPSCGIPLQWSRDFLKCTNTQCRAQVVQAISHWFKTLGNADWFGLKTIEKLVEGGFDSLEKIYEMDIEDFSRLGFGPVQSKNLFEALQTSRAKEVEDWRFLAAIGVPDLGKGESRKLLSYFRLASLPDISAEQIENIKGFGQITSKSIARGLVAIRDHLAHMLSLDFHLQQTPLFEEIRPTQTPISGKRIVFTGKMAQGTRNEIQEAARRLGAQVQTSVSGTTDILVCGEKPGSAKLKAAQENSVRIVSEKEFLESVSMEGTEQRS
jgi:DNA ligase (NAD+)